MHANYPIETALESLGGYGVRHPSAEVTTLCHPLGNEP
jgi:hypothetical protein